MIFRSALLFATLAAVAHGQAFDVASVKPVPRDAPFLEFGCSADGRFLSRNRDLRQAIEYAFDVKPFQVKNLPSWITAADGRFDIEAKAASNVSQDQCRAMVRQLLTDRFQMKTHREDQNTKVVLLNVGKDGPKMSRPVEGSNEPGVKITINGQSPKAAPGGPRDAKPPVGWTMEQLAGVLGFAFAFNPDGARPVVDRTGLEGLFRLTLDFGVTFPGQPQTLEYPDVFSAVQKLGLKLEERTEPFSMLMIDRLEKPDSN